VLVIGLGDEDHLSLDTMRVVGRIAAREAVRLKAKHVSFAPVLRDQGNDLLPVGDRNGPGTARRHRRCRERDRDAWRR
jgi:hypothetical protein